MAAYAALLSFKLSLEDLMESSQLPTDQSKFVHLLHAEIKSLYEVVDKPQTRCWREREKPLLQRIRDAVWNVEDKLDNYVSTTQSLSVVQKTTSSSSDLRDLSCSPAINTTIDHESEILSFVQGFAKLKEEYVLIQDGEEGESSLDLDVQQERDSEEWEVEESDDEEEEEGVEYNEGELRSTSNYGMIGLADQFILLRAHLLLTRSGPDILSILGMAGIGKTTMAKQLYNDPLISKQYKRRVFVSVGRSPNWKQLFIDILTQIHNRCDTVDMHLMSMPKLVDYLKECMGRKKYLIVLDDVWNNLEYSTISCLYGSQETRILITTRIESAYTYHAIKLRLLNEEESWALFCEKVFGKDRWCPFKLVKVGKKIVENCEGLPLAIVAIAGLLAQGEMTLDHWEKVSEDPNPLSIGTDGQHPALDVLYSSYDELEQRLQVCFLYMGVVPRRQEIPLSKLTRLWEAERLVLLHKSTDRVLIHGTAMEIMEKLSSHSVVLVTPSTLPNGIKTIRLHSVFWHLCVSEARKEYSFQIVDTFSRYSFGEALNGHRRICVHNNTLFGIKDANRLMSSVSSVRSLLCMGSHHQYPVPMEFKQMRLLRVLDVLTIRFYVFPSDVGQLVLLRYLAFTYNGMLHASISHLLNLESLIVEPHIRIVSLDDPLHMPVEIWKMKKLRHLQVTGALLPHPPKGAILPNLQSISKIDAQCLTNAVFRCIPNLLKLSLQIDLSAHDPFGFSEALSRVDTLHSLKCVLVNPKPRSQTIDPPAPSKIFPLNLRKLTLSGFGYPWKCFEELGELDSLQVLKLRNYAFQGPEWKTNVHFYWLEVLHLEDLDLVQWRPVQEFASHLKKLTIRHCYKLREIPLEVAKNSHLELIELVDVQPSVVASAKDRVQWENDGGFDLQLKIDCSCKDGNQGQAMNGNYPYRPA